MPLTARSILEQSLARRLGGYYSGQSNNGAANASDLIDTSGDSPFNPNDSANKFRNAWILITSGSPVNDLRTIGTYSAGTGITAARAFSQTVHSGVDYEVHTMLPPSAFGGIDGEADAINYVIRNTWEWRLLPLNVLVDGDMVASGVAHWSSGGGGTRLKVQATYGVIQGSIGVWSGRQGLYIDNNAAGEQVLSEYVDLHWGSRYVLEMVAKSARGEALSFNVQDGNTNIFTNTSGTIASDEWRFHSVEFTTLAAPTDAQARGQLVFARQGGVRSRGFIDFVQLVRVDQTRYVLPSYITAKAHVAGIYYLTSKEGPADRLRYREIKHWDCVIDPAGPSPLVLVVGPTVGGSTDDIGKNLWIMARVPAEELPQRTDVTYLDSDLILDGAEARSYEILMRGANVDDMKRYRAPYIRALTRYRQRRKLYTQEPAWSTQLVGGWVGVG